MMRKRRFAGLGNRCEVKLFIPPEHIVEIAEERTRGMVTYYLFIGDTRTETLRRLVRSAYIQGLNDMVEAVIRDENHIR